MSIVRKEKDTPHKYILHQSLLKMKLFEFLERKLEQEGLGFIDVEIFPSYGNIMRIIIHVQRRRREKDIKRDLEAVIKEMFNIEQPVIEFHEIETIELNAVAMAQRIANAIGKGLPYRHVVFNAMRRIIEKGAAGVEVRIAGKTATKRASARRFATGLILKVGDHIQKRISKGKAKVLLKSGLLGIQVRIILPEVLPTKK
ncbi:MAG: hypothetical protein QXL15_00805 [Candidatus Korarchaeota archaeon]